jgi:putative PIN family toxin of toxin-antitoxin system
VERWRVVLDSNVLISALQFGGKPERILRLALTEAFIALTSNPLKEELRGVLQGKFKMPAQLASEVCAAYWLVAECVFPLSETHLCPDEADNRVIECAIDGCADFIVTGDRHLLNLAPIQGFSIVNPNGFLSFLDSQPLKSAASGNS